MPSFRLVLIGIGAIVLLVAGAYGALVLASPASSNFGQPTSNREQSVTLNGAGATLAYPLLSLITGKYTEIHPNVLINYQPIGSVGGIKQFTLKTVDFGATYPPMNAAQRAKAPNALHVPEAISALAVAYNIQGVPTGLRLTGSVLAKIFLGNISRWDDPELVVLNPGAHFPSTTIITIHQEEGDGTTFVFTSYLTQQSPKWAQLVGAGTFVQWPPLVPVPPPVSLSISSSAGVAALIGSTANSIGYMELSYALQSGLTYASIQNHAGNFVLPSLETAKAADADLNTALPSGDGDWSDVNLLDEPGPNAYPMVTFTYLIIYRELNVVPSMDLGKAKALVSFAWYAVHDGQALGSPLQYVPLTQDIISINEQSLKSITFNGQLVFTTG